MGKAQAAADNNMLVIDYLGILHAWQCSWSCSFLGLFTFIGLPLAWSPLQVTHVWELNRGMDSARHGHSA